MTDDERMALIHAELDGELSSQQRGDLARLLLAEPQMRARRDELHRLSSRLDSMEQVEPPSELRDAILRRLPPVAAPVVRRWPSARWRLAALLAGVLTAGTVVYQVLQGPGPGISETSGTIAAGTPAAVDSVDLVSGPVTGRATLYRDKSGLVVGLDVSASEPINVVITAGGEPLIINNLGSKSAGTAAHRSVLLPGVVTVGQEIELTFLIRGRAVSQATLHAPPP